MQPLQYGLIPSRIAASFPRRPASIAVTLFALVGALFVGIVGDRIERDGGEPLAAQGTTGEFRLAQVAEVGTVATSLAIGANDLVIAGVGRRLRLVDFAAPARPQVLGETPLLADSVTAVAAAAGSAYTAVGNGEIQVVDISDPATPRLGPVILLPGRPTTHALAVEGDTLYAASRDGRLHVIDITRPGEPWWLASIDTSRRVHSLIVQGTAAYVSDAWGLSIVDVADPRQLQVVGRYPRPGDSHSTSPGDGALAVSGGWAFLALRPDLHIIDVTNPVRPRPVTRFKVEWVAQLVIRDQRLYALTNRYPAAWDVPSTLHVLDVSRSPAIETLAAHELRTEAPVLAMGSTGLFLADARSGIRGIEVDAGGLRQTSRIPVEHAERVAVSGDRAAVAVHDPAADTWRLVLYDIRQPSAPAQLGDVILDADVIEMAWTGDHVLVLSSTALYVVDVADPRRPAVVGSLRGLPYTRGMDADGPLVLIGHADKGVTIVDVGNPAMPSIVGRSENAGRIEDVVMTRSLAYLADGGPLRILDLADPAAPREITAPALDLGYPGPDQVKMRRLARQDDRLYSFFNAGRLAILDLTKPLAPTPLGILGLDAHTGLLAPGGPWVYALAAPERFGTAANALTVVDVVNPAAPRIAWQQPMPGTLRDAAVTGETVVVAARQAGWLIFSSASPGNPTATPTPRPTGTLAPVAPHPTQVPDPVRPHRAFFPVLLQPAPPMKESVRFTVAPPLGGYSHAVATDGSYAYLLESDDHIVVLDIRDPSDPTIVGKMALPALLPEGFETVIQLVRDGHLLYLVTRAYESPDDNMITRLTIIDIATPARPHVLSTVSIPGMTFGISVAGRHVFVPAVTDSEPIALADGDSQSIATPRLTTIDMADPAAPRIANVAAMSVFLIRAAVVGQRLEGACVEAVDGEARFPGPISLCTVDVANAAQPRLLAATPIDGEAWADSSLGMVKTADGHVLAGLSMSNGEGNALRFRMNALGVSEGVEPLQLGPFERHDGRGYINWRDLNDFAATDRYLLGVDRYNDSLAVLDLNNLTAASPLALVRVVRSQPFHDERNISVLAATGDTALLAAGDGGGLRVLTPLRPPDQPQGGRYAPPGKIVGLAAEGAHLYLCEGSTFSIWNRATPADPERVGQVEDACGYSIAIANTSGLAFANSGWLHAIDIRDPANPALVDVFKPGDSKLQPRPSFRDLATDGTHAIIADPDFGLRIFGIDREAKLVQISSLPSVGRATAVDVDSGRAYLGTTAGIVLGSGGPLPGTTADLAVIDIGVPTAPVEIGFVTLDASVLAVTARDRWAFAVTGSDPYSQWSEPRRRPPELVTVDVADPAHPRAVASLHLPDLPVVTNPRMHWVGNLLYVEAYSGILAIDVADPTHPQWVGWLPMTGPITVAPDGRRLYVGGDGLSVVDVESR